MAMAPTILTVPDPGRRREDDHQDDGQQVDRKGEDEVHHPHHDGVDSAPVVPGNQPQRDPEAQGQKHRRDADRQRDPASVDDAGEHVASELVGAEQVGAARALEGRRLVDGDRTPGGQHVREASDGDERKDDGQAEEGGCAASEPADALSERRRRSRRRDAFAGNQDPGGWRRHIVSGSRLHRGRSTTSALRRRDRGIPAPVARERPGVDSEVGAGDHRRVVRGQEHDRVSVVGRARAACRGGRRAHRARGSRAGRTVGPRDLQPRVPPLLRGALGGPARKTRDGPPPGRTSLLRDHARVDARGRGLPAVPLPPGSWQVPGWRRPRSTGSAPSTAPC